MAELSVSLFSLLSKNEGKKTFSHVFFSAPFSSTCMHMLDSYF